MMAHRINGIGTWPCKAGYDVGWGGDDAVECFTLFYFPLIPLESVHIWGEDEAIVMTRAAIIPIRWSSGLVAQVLLRGWSRVFLVFSIFFVPLGLLLLAFPSPKNPEYGAQMFWYVSVPPFVLWILGSLWSRSRTARPRKIRLLLGPHTLGTSDPATWTDETVRQAVSSLKALLDAESFSHAAELFLSRNDFHKAMWSARLCAAWEDRAQGERLTDQILQHPRFSEALKTARSRSHF
jgi:hypothetical protein